MRRGFGDAVPGDVAQVTCQCGQVTLGLEGVPFMVVECCCTFCRDAGERFLSLSPNASTFSGSGAVPFALQRNDQLRILSGKEHLAAHRLDKEATTARVLATCCNTPMYLQMKGGHWVSLYATLWPEEQRPKPEMRTMTRDFPNKAALSIDIPNLETHSLAFYWRLFKPWVGMGFRNHAIEIERSIDA